MSDARVHPERSSGRRPLLGLVLLLTGALAVLVRARFAFEPSDTPPRVFELGLWFGPAARIEQGELVSLLGRLAWLRLAWAALAIPLGALAGRALARRCALGPGGRGLLAFGGALTLLLADPVGLAGFVAERGFAGAPHYLELEDLLRGLGLTAIALGTLLVGGAGRPEDERGVPPSRVRTALGLALACLVAGGLPLAFAVGALSSRTSSTDGAAHVGGLDRGRTVLQQPLTNDGRAYAFQAELFASGRLTLDAGQGAELFAARQVLRNGSRFASKYPPGHSLLLTPGTWLEQRSERAERAGLARLLPALLQGAMPLLVFALARRLGARRPLLAAWLFALSPTPLVLGALWLSHGTSLPFATLGLLAGLTALDAEGAGQRKRAVAAALLTGLALSICGLARPGTALAVASPLCLLLAARPARALRLAPPALLAALPAALCFAWINLATTGDALVPAYVRYASEVSPDDRWGLANLASAPTALFLNGARLGTWLHGSGLSVGLAWLGCAVWSGRRRGLLVGVPLALAAFYALLTFHGVPWAGPLYWVEGFPLLVILSSEGLHVLGASVGRRVPRSLLVAAVVGSALLIAARVPLARAELAVREAHRAAELRYRSLDRSGVELLVEVPLMSGVEIKRRFLAPPTELGTDDPSPRTVFIVGGGGSGLPRGFAGRRRMVFDRAERRLVER